jgi:hypothetical protein
MKRSIAAIPSAWLRRNVFHPCEGGLLLRAKYLGPFGGSAVDACKDLEPHDGYPPIYKGKIERHYLDQQNTFIASEAFMNGNRTFFVHGCASYRCGWSLDRKG